MAVKSIKVTMLRIKVNSWNFIAIRNKEGFYPLVVSDKALLRVTRRLFCECEGRGDLLDEVPPRSLQALTPCRSQRLDRS